MTYNVFQCDTSPFINTNKFNQYYEAKNPIWDGEESENILQGLTYTQLNKSIKYLF